MRERLLILWTRALCAHAAWLQRHLLVAQAALREIYMRRQAEEYAADLQRIAREAAETDRFLRGNQ